MPRERTPGRASPILVGIVATIMIGWVLSVGASILQPLVFALLLCAMLQPLVVKLARWHIPPPMTVIALVSLLSYGVARLGILLQANILAFVGSPPRRGSLDEATQRANLGGWEGVVANLSQRLRETEINPALADIVINAVREIDLQGVATGLVGTGIDFLRTLVLVVIYMLFIFAESAVFRSKILSVAGERREETRELLDTISRGIQRYLGVKTIASLLTGAICYSVLVALGIPYAPLFAFLTFALNYIPTFGSIIAGIFPTATALAVSPGLQAPIIVVITYFAVNLTIGSFLEPKVLGRELNLSPLVIIVSVVVWAGLWGVVGGVLAVPLTSAIQIVLAGFQTTRPIAVVLSSGPTGSLWRTGRRGRRRGGAANEDVSRASRAARTRSSLR